MKTSDVTTRTESANPVSSTAFREWAETPEARKLLDRIIATPIEDPPSYRGVLRRPRSLVAGAAALLLILGVFVALSWRQSRPETGSVWAAPLVAIAEDAPRLLIAQADWNVLRADEFSGKYGEMTFANGTYKLDLHWIPARLHEDRIRNVRANSMETTWTATIDGRSVEVFRYGPTPGPVRKHEDANAGNVTRTTTTNGRPVDQTRSEGPIMFTAVWRDGRHSIELFGTFPNVESFKSVAGTLQSVDIHTWLSALPESVVTPDRRAASVDEMLADIPVHPSVDIAKLKASEWVSDRYQLGTKVTGAVACAWIQQWVVANANGDEARAEAAENAMATSHDWAILEAMTSEGDWPVAVWEYAGAMPDNSPVSGGRPMTIEEAYASTLGCESN